MKLIIFDIDGTLTCTKEVDDECFIAAFQDEYKVTLPNTDWTTFQNVTDSGLYTEIYSTFFQSQPNEIQKKKFQKRFFAYLGQQVAANPKRFTEIAGASDFIDYCLKKPGYKIAFATGGWEYSAKMKLRIAKIFYSDLPFIGSDSFLSRQEIIKQSILISQRKHQLESFKSIIYIGDGEWDFETAGLLKIPFIGVDNNNNNRLKNIGVKNIIKDYTDVGLVLNFIDENK